MSHGLGEAAPPPLDGDPEISKGAASTYDDGSPVKTSHGG
jgi:hypothetical protein